MTTPSNVIELPQRAAAHIQVTVPFRNMPFKMRLQFVWWVLLGREFTFEVPGLSARITQSVPVQPQPRGGANA